MSYGVIGNTSGFGPEESRFEPLWDNHMVAIAQLVRASDCGSGGRGFDSH